MKQVKSAAEILRAICNPTRIKILSIIDKNPGKSVTNIHTKLKLEQTIVSNHLKILKKVQLLDMERDGTYIYYSINYDQVKKVNELIVRFDYGFWFR